MAKFGFNVADVEPPKAMDLLPKGDYIAQVVASEMIETKAGTGTMLKLEFNILDGQYTGRKLWARLNVRNVNAEAEKIGQQQLRQLVDAAGLPPTTSDSDDLHMRPVIVKVKIRQDKTGTYGDQNDVAGFAAVQGTQATLPPSKQPVQAAKPWGRAA